MRPLPHPLPTGVALLHNPTLNKGIAFTQAERDALGLQGLLPPRVLTLEDQLARSIENFQLKPSDIEKYIYMAALQDRNETLFYRVVVDHVQEMMPIIYTPTVGEACQRYGHLFRRSRGLYISAKDRGRIRQVLGNWPEPDIGVIVVTDGERILGLGDLGAYGIGIPIGKLALYTALAGIHPSACLPVMLDVGTNRKELLDDPLYTGLTQERLRGEPYDDLVEEFVVAVQDAFPSALIQFEDFATQNALGLLARYRERVRCFNDDIQGTAAVTLAGVLSAGRLTGRALVEQTILFQGAGAAAVGIADLFVNALVRDGLDEATARLRIWFVDSRGLVVDGRDHLAAHKLGYAHRHEFLPDLASAVARLQPTVLIGVSGQAGAFTEPIVRDMAHFNERPIIFALSNPTAKAECTAENAYRWTDGKAVFASGSPFDPVELNGRHLVPGQGNNAYIFPGVGLGVMASGATRVTDKMFYAAALSLAEYVHEGTQDEGSVYPSLTSIRDVSARIAVAVANEAYAANLAAAPLPDDLMARVRSLMWDPVYRSYV